jgi:hypothetical protein
MRLSERGFTLPWQLVELQEPGPVYFPASAGGFAARGGFSEAKKIAPSQTTAHRSVNRLASGPILIPVLGWSPALFAQAVEPARVRIFILPAGSEVNERKWIDFLVSNVATVGYGSRRDQIAIRSNCRDRTSA